MLMQTVNSCVERTVGMSYTWPEPDEHYHYEEWEPDYQAHRLFEEHMHTLEAEEYDRQRRSDEELECAEALWATEEEAMNADLC